jgi:hypothetical protein
MAAVVPPEVSTALGHILSNLVLANNEIRSACVHFLFALHLGAECWNLNQPHLGCTCSAGSTHRWT